MANEEKKFFFWFECTECNYKAAFSSNLKHHMESHTKNQRIKCPLCSFSSNFKPQVHRHLMLNHFTLLDAVPSQSNYLLKIENVIQNLLVINEKQLESIERSGPNDFLINLVDKNAHRKQQISYKRQFKCKLCNYSATQKFVFCIRHMNRDRQHHKSNISNQDNSNTYSTPGNYLRQSNQFRLRSWAKIAEMNPQQQQSAIGRNVGIENAECIKLINQCRREIRLARLSMTKMRVKVKQQREMCIEKKKRKEHLLYCLKYIKTTNEKLRDLSLKYSKLEMLRGHIGNTNEIKLHYELQLRKLQLNESKRQLFESDLDDEKLLFIKSNDEGLINCLKIHIRILENELENLQEEERILAKDVDLLHKNLHGVVSEVPDYMMQPLQLELEEVEREIKASLQDKVEDLFNFLVLSTEDKIKHLLQLKGIIYSMYYHAN